MHAESLQTPAPLPANRAADEPAASLPASDPQGGARFDLYVGIHKALRLFMTDTLAGLSRCDPRDEADVAAALAQLDGLLDVCAVHLVDENDFIHPAIERARPGFSARIAGEHVEHQEAIDDLRDLAAFVRAQPTAARPAALLRVYRACAVFVGENFEHMNFEETEHNAVLWSAYTDAEIMAIEHRIIAAIPPEAMMAMTPWFMRALNAVELAAMLNAMRAGMPPAAFDGILAVARDVLPAARYATVARDLGVG